MDSLDPRVAAYIKRKMQENEEDDSPDTRAKLAAEDKEVLDQQRNNNLGALFGQSAAMAGTIHGEAANAKPLVDFMDKENQRLGGSLALRDRLRKRSEMDPRVLSYLMKEKEAKVASERPLEYVDEGGKKRTGRYISGQGFVGSPGDPLAPEKKDTLAVMSPYQEAMVGIAKDRVDLAKKAKESKPTKGQDSLDNAFAKDYAEYVAGGGYADVMGNLKQLREARNRLSKSDMVSGPIIGRVPFGDVISPDSAATQEEVAEVAQRNLRLVLGGQFAQQEGAALIQRAYNPRLEEKENIRRLDRLIDKMEKAAKAKQAAVEYFEEHGSLRGFKGKLPSSADFGDIVTEKQPDAGAVPKKQYSKSRNQTRIVYPDGRVEVLDGKQ